MSLAQLRDAVQIDWDKIPQDAIDYLIHSIPKRVAKCIQVKGSATH